jgi:hypothetical protein
MENQQLKVKNILVKGEIQQRAGLNQDYIDELSELIANRAVLPPIDVYDVDGALLLADGFHRLEAYKKAGIGTVEVNIYKGAERDAILHAVGANAKHGLRRKNADKRRAVMTLLTDDEWQLWSDCEIARRVQVSPTFVSKVKRELIEKGVEFSPVRKCADGRVIDTTKIGERQSDDTVTEETSETESVGVAANEEMAAETSDEEMKSAYTDNLEDMIKDIESESATMGSESNSTPESDDKTIALQADANSIASEVDDNQPQSEGISEVDDVQPTEDKISELEKIIKEKDQRISELETENEKLQARICELEVQAEVFDDYEDSITDIEPDKEFAY